MKVKKKLQPEVQKFGGYFADQINQSSFIQWITDNPKLLLYLSLALVVFFLIGIRWTAINWFKSESDYVRAELHFANLKQLPVENQSEAESKILANLKEIINAHPELHSKYDIQVAQILIARGKFSEATAFLKNSKHIQDSNEALNFYTQFSKTSFLIEKGKYENALQHALVLKQDLINKAQDIKEKSTQFSNVLFAYNLLRIAFLNQQLEDEKGELAAWQEWKKYANDKMVESSIDIQAFRDIVAQFDENNISLQEYIQSRERKLSS
jgi:hypothetical protein